MGCNCKTLKRKEDIFELKNDINFDFTTYQKIVLMTIFIGFKISSSIKSVISFLKHGKKLQNKG